MRPDRGHSVHLVIEYEAPPARGTVGRGWGGEVGGDGSQSEPGRTASTRVGPEELEPWREKMPPWPLSAAEREGKKD